MKHIVCYSGGHSSALVAVEVVRKYGKENVILLNHDISSEVEHEDIKRFKNEVAEYLGIDNTYANMDGWEFITPLKLARKLGGFKFNNSPALCTYHLKTMPFKTWLKESYPVKDGEVREDVVIYYGFDKDEPARIQRRSSIMATMGYRTEYPLAYWERTILNIEEIGIQRPITYEQFRHANCIGCLKAGKQQWYLVYCLYPHIWEEAKAAENEIGFSILKNDFLEDLEPQFRKMKCQGIVPTEKIGYQKFWIQVKRILKEDNMIPCECSF